MSPELLLALCIAAFAGIPMAVAGLRSDLRTALLYAYIATMTLTAGLLGPVYTIPLSDGTVIWAGQVLFAAFIFSTMLTTILGRELDVVRKVIAVTVLVNLVGVIAFGATHTALDSGLPNPLQVPGSMFAASITQQLIGVVLSVIELIGLLAILELAKARLPSRAMVPVYPLTYLAVLLFDGLLYPLLVLRPTEGLLDVVADGVRGKLVLGLGYAVPLLLFVLVSRGHFRRFESRQLGLRHLADLSRDPLLDQLDTTARTAERASATTARILDAATSTVLVATDPALVVTHFNRGAERLLERPAASVVDRPLEELLPGLEVARHAAALGVGPDLASVVRAQLEAGEPRDWSLAQGGQDTVLSLNITVIGSDGRVDGYLFAGEDVTDRLRAEEAVRAALDHEQSSLARLREVDRVKQQLISTVSHELRTPIASIHGYLELLADGDYGALTSPQCGAVQRALRGTARLERLVDDLLILERAEAGQLGGQRVEVDVRQVVLDAVELLRQRTAGLSIELDLPGSPLTAVGDPEALHRVVLNLVDNALKFTPHPGSVVVRLGDLGPGVRLQVEDTGIGISPDDQPLVFTKFFRTSGALEMEAQGTGLGLSIVSTLVEDHGGTIRVESELHRGTTVTVDLP